MKKTTAAMLMTATLALVLTGCGSRTVNITTTEMKFDPAVIEVKPGEKIKFVIDNKGTVEHEFVSDDIKFHEVEVDEGETKSVVVTMPDKAGEYEFFCEAKGHKEAGMVGKIVVKP